MATSAKQKVRIHDQTGTERIKSKITIYQEAIYSRYKLVVLQVMQWIFAFDYLSKRL